MKDADLGLFSAMMVGIGSSLQDYIEHIFWLKELRVDYLLVIGLIPVPDTPFENRKPAHLLKLLES